MSYLTLSLQSPKEKIIRCTLILIVRDVDKVVKMWLNGEWQKVCIQVNSSVINAVMQEGLINLPLPFGVIIFTDGCFTSDVVYMVISYLCSNMQTVSLSNN